MKSVFSNKRREWIYFAIGVFLSILMLHTLRLHTDNTQITDKAVRLLTEGEWTHFGNQASHVGNLPGTLLTVLSAGPMAMYFSIWSALLMVVAFHVASYFFLRSSFREIAGHSGQTLQLSGIVLVLIYWLNPWRVEQAEFYNVGYLFFFSALHFWTAQKMKDKSFWFTFLHTIAVGLCVQFHFSFFILGVISVFLLVWNQVRVSWLGWFAGVFVSIVSLIPYVTERYFSDYNPGDIPAQNLDFVQSQAFPGRGLVFVYPLLKGVLYFFRLGSTYYGRHIFSEIEFSWIPHEPTRLVVSSVFHVVKFPITLATLGLSFYFLGQFVRKFWSQKRPFNRKQGSLEEQASNRMQWYVFSMFCAVVFAGMLTPVDFSHWHFVICLPAVSVFFAWKFLMHDRVIRNFKMFEFGVLGLFIVWNLFAAFGSRSHELKLDYAEQFYQHYTSKGVDLDQYLGRSILLEYFGLR